MWETPENNSDLISWIRLRLLQKTAEMYVFIQFFPPDVVAIKTYLKMIPLFWRGLQQDRKRFQRAAECLTPVSQDEYSPIPKPHF